MTRFLDKSSLSVLLPLLVIALVGSIPFFGFLLSDVMLYGSDQIGGFGNFVQYQAVIRRFEIQIEQHLLHQVQIFASFFKEDLIKLG